MVCQKNIHKTFSSVQRNHVQSICHILRFCEEIAFRFTTDFLCLHWHRILGTQLGGEGGGLPFLFLEIGKSLLILDKKGPTSVHLWFKFSIKNVVLRVSWREKSKILATFFLVILTNIYRSAVFPRKYPLPKKIPIYAPKSHYVHVFQ